MNNGASREGGAVPSPAEMSVGVRDVLKAYFSDIFFVNLLNCNKHVSEMAGFCLFEPLGVFRERLGRGGGAPPPAETLSFKMVL